MDRKITTGVALAVALAAALLFTSAWRTSPTVDETHYAGLGRYLVETGDWSIRGAILHPPIPYYMNSLFLSGVEIPDSVWDAPHQDERGRRLFRLGAGDGMLHRTRLANMLVFLVLVVVVYAEGSRMLGRPAALAAAFFVALEPNLLAHAGLGTPDLPLTAAFFWAACRFEAYCRDGGAGRLLIAGVALGAAILTKYTALLLVGILPLAALFGSRDRRRLAAFPLVCLVAFAVLHAGYLPALVHGGGGEDALFRYGLPAPFVKGIEFQRAANTGHRAFFLGEVSDRGWALYYPIAFLVKTPIPFLLLAAAGLLLLFRAPLRREQAFRIAVPPLALALFFVVVSRIDIGLRYLLPVYPFAALAAGHGLRELWIRHSPRFRIPAALLAAWMLAGTAIAWPHFIPYFNEAVGGGDGGVRILADSNLDWGQDLPGLKKWLDRNGYEGTYLAYFGNADPSRYGIRFRYLPGWLYTPMKELRAGVGFHPDPELLAISRSVYQGFWLPDPELYRWVDHYPRVASIGHSIDVYDIGGDPAAHDKLALIYKRAGRTDYFRDELILGMEEKKAGRKRGGDEPDVRP